VAGRRNAGLSLSIVSAASSSGAGGVPGVPAGHFLDGNSSPEGRPISALALEFLDTFRTAVHALS